MPSAWSSDVCSRSEEHTSELQSHDNLVCRLLLEKKYHAVRNLPTRTRLTPLTRPTAPRARDPPRFERAGQARARQARGDRAGLQPMFFFKNARPPESQ